MIRTSIATLAACLYLAASAWIVGLAGESHRAGLRRDRLAASKVAEPSPPVATTKAEAPPIAPAPREIASPPEVKPPVVVAEAKPEPLPKAPPPPADPPADPGPAPSPKVDPFWETPALKQVWDVGRMGTDDERQFGQALHALITGLQPTLPEGPLTRRLYEAAEPMLEGRSRKDITYKFTILDADDLNAFSHPGGFVYATRGLVQAIGEDEDYALQFILGHEIAHVDLKHMLRCLNNPAVKAVDAGTLAKAYLIVLPWGYWPEDLDFDADRWALDRLRAIGRTRRESFSFLNKLQDYARKHGFEFERKRFVPDDKASPLENHIKAHPPVRDRLKRLEALWPLPAR